MCLFNPALRIPVSASALSLLDFPNNHVHHSKYGYLDEARILAGLKKNDPKKFRPLTTGR